MKAHLILTAALALTACATTPAAVSDPQDTFFDRLSALCGQTFEGRVTTDDPVDADFRSQRLVMQVRDCSADEIGIPFAVGEDRSRRWVITRTDAGLRLKHDHRDEAGEIHGFHMYGGDTADEGTAERQEFPVDQESIDQFLAADAAVSTTNVWAMEVRPGEAFVYELSRPNRLLRVEFDLSRPVQP